MTDQSPAPLTSAPPPGHEVAFPRLSRAHIDGLRPLGEVRAVRRGDTLFEEGDRGVDFFVVLSGAVRIVESSSGVAREITVHGPGNFTGDVDLLTGRAILVSGIVAEDGEVLALSPGSFRDAVAKVPDLSDVLLRALLMRRTLLLGAGLDGLKIVGSRYSPAAHQLTDFAQRNGIPFTWLDVETDERAERLLCEFRVRPEETPVVISGDGELLRNPTIAQMADCIGLAAEMAPGALLDLVIVGAGPAGLAAAVYAASEGLQTVVLDSVAPGGQAGTSSRIENYLGFPTGISGRELTANALFQAQRFGARVSIARTVKRVRVEGGARVLVLDDDSELAARCVLIASGVNYRRLEVPGLNQFEGAGVYYAATEMEARICRGDEVVVVGGGNSAGQAVVYLSHVARKVQLVVRGDGLAHSMSRYLIDRISSIPNVELLTNTVVTGLQGTTGLEAVTVRDLRTGEGRSLPAVALFTFIGAVPHTDFLGDCVRLDRKGFILTGTDLRDGVDSDDWRGVSRSPFFLETSLPGVFAAGDVRSGSVKRVASAVGEGAMAVSFVHAHLAAR